MRTLAWIGFVTLAAGCMAPAPTGAENPRLGIARFDVQETAGASTVIGRDAHPA